MYLNLMTYDRCDVGWRRRVSSPSQPSNFEFCHDSTTNDWCADVCFGRPLFSCLVATDLWDPIYFRRFVSIVPFGVFSFWHIESFLSFFLFFGHTLRWRRRSINRAHRLMTLGRSEQQFRCFTSHGWLWNPYSVFGFPLVFLIWSYCRQAQRYIHLMRMPRSTVSVDSDSFSQLDLTRLSWSSFVLLQLVGLPLILLFFWSWPEGFRPLTFLSWLWLPLLGHVVSLSIWWLVFLMFVFLSNATSLLWKLSFVFFGMANLFCLACIFLRLACLGRSTCLSWLLSADFFLSAYLSGLFLHYMVSCCSPCFDHFA